jgi:hypothetical protein
MYRQARAGVGRTELAIGAAVIAVLVLITWPLVTRTNTSSRSAEVPLNVDHIRAALLAYHGAFAEYVEAEAAPRRPEEVNDQAVPWNPSRGFKALAWEPEETAQVWGSYSIKLVPGGFEVIGTCDTDADGRRATWVATHDKPAQRTSAEGVH